MEDLEIDGESNSSKFRQAQVMKVYYVPSYTLFTDIKLVADYIPHDPGLATILARNSSLNGDRNRAAFRSMNSMQCALNHVT